MSSFSSPGKIIHLPLSFGEHTSDTTVVISRESGCLTPNQGQMSVSELCQMEILEEEYTHFQHMRVEAGPPEGPDDESHPATVTVEDATGSTAIYPLTATQAVDLSTIDEHCLLMAGEKTPPSHGEVPGFVLASVRDEDGPTEPHPYSSTSSLKRSRSAVRVCLDQRFNAMSADTSTLQDIQSPFPSKWLTMLQQSAESQETVMHPQMGKLMKTDRGYSIEVSNSFVKVIGVPHMVVSFPFDCHQEMVARRGNNSTEEQQLVITESDSVTSAASSRNHDIPHSCQPIEAAETPQDFTGESGRKNMKRPCFLMPVSQRRELHNIRERNRRKIIRSCCDELNMLVPFCNSHSDKATTLQWTTAFLRYINKSYGDNFREEFMVFTNGKGFSLLPSSSSDQNRIHQEVNETPIDPRAFEQ